MLRQSLAPACCQTPPEPRPARPPACLVGRATAAPTPGRRLRGRGLLARCFRCLRPGLRLGCTARRGLSPAAHELAAERALRGELVVRAAAEPQVGDGRAPSARDRLDVVVFQQLACLAALPVLAHVRALAAVAFADRALDLRRDVPAVRRTPRLARAGSGRELPFLELLDQCIQSALQHLCDIARGQCMTEQVLRVTELLVGLLVDRDLQREPARRER